MTEQATTLTSAAAARGPLAMEAISVSKDFKIGRGQFLHAVRDVSFNLYRGAVVALVGESGSGKSTAARLLAGQERLTSGAIKLDGKPVEVTSRGDFRRYKSQVQYVFQDPFSSLNPVHTVQYHLERPLKLHHGKGANTDTEVAALMEQVRLTPANALPGQVPARAVRRPAPAGLVRPGARRPPDRAAGRRAGVHAGRLDPARDAETARRPARALQPGHAVHHPRHRLGPVLRRRGAGHVRRRDRGAAARPRRSPSSRRIRTRNCSSPRPRTPTTSAARLRRGANGTRRQGPQRTRTPERAATAGCPFSPRCPLAEDRCREEDPPLLPITATRGAACWRLDAAAPELVPGRREADAQPEI